MNIFVHEIIKECKNRTIDDFYETHTCNVIFYALSENQNCTFEKFIIISLTLQSYRFPIYN